jgi:hypothetical protein
VGKAGLPFARLVYSGMHARLAAHVQEINFQATAAIRHGLLAWLPDVFVHTRFVSVTAGLGNNAALRTRRLSGIRFPRYLSEVIFRMPRMDHLRVHAGETRKYEVNHAVPRSDTLRLRTFDISDWDPFQSHLLGEFARGPTAARSIGSCGTASGWAHSMQCAVLPLFRALTTLELHTRGL